MDIERHRNTDRQEELLSFLTSHYVGSLTGSSPEQCVIFFAVVDNKLVFKSRTASAHSEVFAKNTAAGLSVYSHDSNYSAKYGAQVKGVVKRILNVDEMRAATASYGDKFEGATEKLPETEELLAEQAASTFYYFIPSEFRIIDETKKGNRTMLKYKEYVLET